MSACVARDALQGESGGKHYGRTVSDSDLGVVVRKKFTRHDEPMANATESRGPRPRPSILKYESAPAAIVPVALITETVLPVAMRPYKKRNSKKHTSNPLSVIGVIVNSVKNAVGGHTTNGKKPAMISRTYSLETSLARTSGYVDIQRAASTPDVAHFLNEELPVAVKVINREQERLACVKCCDADGCVDKAHMHSPSYMICTHIAAGGRVAYSYDLPNKGKCRYTCLYHAITDLHRDASGSVKYTVSIDCAGCCSSINQKEADFIIAIPHDMDGVSIAPPMYIHSGCIEIFDKGGLYACTGRAVQVAVSMREGRIYVYDNNRIADSKNSPRWLNVSVKPITRLSELQGALP